MQIYTITYKKKLGVNRYSEEIPVGQIDAALLGEAKRDASEYIHHWLQDNMCKVRTKEEWELDRETDTLTREYFVSEGALPATYIFIVRAES